MATALAARYARMITRRTHDRDSVGELLAAMAAWPHPERVAAGLHQGDLGWHLRFDDDAIEGAFVGWWDGDALLAVGLLEGVVGRFAVRPGRERDAELGEHVAQACRELAGDEVYADLRAETATRRILAGEGWTLDPEPWVALHADLDRWQPTVDARRRRRRRGRRRRRRPGGGAARGLRELRPSPTTPGTGWPPAPATDATSTSWWSATGSPVSIATAWWAGEGATAILEPVATHHDHRGRGWGVRAVTALVTRLRDLGASGVTVCTPLDYVGAVATYRAAGLRPVEHFQSVIRQSTA